jgi:hypothetical protein
MESIQKQISTLTEKVDLISETLDRLHQKVFEPVDLQPSAGEETSIKHPRNHDDITRFDGTTARRRGTDANHQRNNSYTDLPTGANYRRDTSEWAIAQQDILIDSSGVEISHHQIKEQDLSPQIQIQRLTAQLTAAYNRIAALEEQLLAKRWK